MMNKKRRFQITAEGELAQAAMDALRASDDFKAALAKAHIRGLRISFGRRDIPEAMPEPHGRLLLTVEVQDA